MLQRLLRASKTIVFRLRFDLIGGCQASVCRRLLSAKSTLTLQWFRNRVDACGPAKPSPAMFFTSDCLWMTYG